MTNVRHYDHNSVMLGICGGVGGDHASNVLGLIIGGHIK